MNPPNRATELVHNNDVVNVVNRSTGQVYFCKKNPETNYFEVIDTSSASLKVVNLEAKFSKVCDHTYKVILYAKDTSTGRLRRYIFENNDIRQAPDCHCDGCKLTANEFGDNTSVFTNANGTPLILLSIAWTGCHFRGKCETFLDPISGVIGTYRRTGMGLVVEQQNQVIQLFPCQDLSKPLNHHLSKVGHCPHLDQNIYVCGSAGVLMHLTFNRRHMRFESVYCGCTFDDFKPVFHNEERMMDHFPSLRQGTYIGIFTSAEGMLEWKYYTAETNAWVKNSPGERVFDYSHLSCHELMLRYNFYKNDQEPFLDTLDGQSKDLLFTEPTPFGNIYWMVNKNHEILPYKYAKTPFSFYGRSKRFSKQYEVSVYRDRLAYKDVLEGKPITRRKHDDLAREINNHTCEMCIRNPKIFVEPRRRHDIDRFSRDQDALDDMMMDDIAAYKAINSSPKNTAPPPPQPPAPAPPAQAVDTGMQQFASCLDPYLFQYTQMQQLRQQELQQQQSQGYLPPRMVAKLRAPVAPVVPPPPATFHRFQRGQQQCTVQVPPGYVPMHTTNMQQGDYQMTKLTGYTSDPAKNPNAQQYYAKYYSMPPSSLNTRLQFKQFEQLKRPEPLKQEAPQPEQEELMMNVADLFHSDYEPTKEEMVKFMEGTRDTDFNLCMPKEAPIGTPTESTSQLPRFQLVQGSSEPQTRELMRTALRTRDDQKETTCQWLPATEPRWTSEQHYARFQQEWGATERKSKAVAAAAAVRAVQFPTPPSGVQAYQFPSPPPPPPPAAEESSSSGESLDEEEEYTDEDEGQTPQNMDTILESLANRVDDLDVNQLD